MAQGLRTCRNGAWQRLFPRLAQRSRASGEDYADPDGSLPYSLG
jgi:hypothetical protein